MADKELSVNDAACSLSLCKSCWCMTHTVLPYGTCGKCGADKVGFMTKADKDKDKEEE